MTSKTSTPKRSNRTVQLGDMIGKTLDPALKKRGFAGRDLISHWQTIAPAPWDKISMPDKLVWPRRDRPDPEGAILHLRCLEGHGLALTHEAQTIASAVNRYFGYLIVGSVRLSPMPLIAEKPIPAKSTQLPLATLEAIKAQTGGIEDDGLREALQKLGRGVLAKRDR
ncbi:DUF721 domain-containing protein [Pelagibacterium sp.]|uniref:DUF721 domain-containing protein n=1 Tax=Pelagibacterium sp. TaxID=1967288 RepID=UPI003A944229